MRGKRVDNGEWVYGNLRLIDQNGNHFSGYDGIPFRPPTQLPQAFIDCIVGPDKVESHQVEYGSLDEAAGGLMLDTDGNITRLYQRDIVRRQSPDGSHKDYYVLSIPLLREIDAPLASDDPNFAGFLWGATRKGSSGELSCLLDKDVRLDSASIKDESIDHWTVVGNATDSPELASK